MPRNTTVTLSSNGKYWQAFYYDTMGKRHAKSLGRKAKLSRRQAKVLCDRLAAELQYKPGLARGRSLRLGEALDRYMASRTDLRGGTRKLHQMTCRYLKEHFGADARIDRIDRSAAADWRAALAQGDLENVRERKQFKGKKNSEASVCQHTRNAKVIFNHAVRDDLVLFNPFDRLRGKAPEPEKNWKDVTLDEFEALLSACPNTGWRIFLTLLRLAGLRRGEALALEWTAVDWGAPGQITVLATKTGKRRVVPVEPKLYELLLIAFEEAEPGESHVVSRRLVRRSSARKRFESIIRRAGLIQWSKLFQALRRNCETDWAQVYPQYVVSYWMGHDITVSDAHYLQVPLELYAKVARTATKKRRRQGVRL